MLPITDDKAIVDYIEDAGEESGRTPSTLPVAYLSRVEINNRGERRIVANNPEFDKVLREWGYLNDK
jgi:hypothetical protein